LAIVLPRKLATSLGDAQLRHVLAHELAHFVRRDHWGSLLSFFVTSLFWWNPIAWLARRELRTAAEACCDGMAISRLAGSRKSYAETLLAVVDFVTSSKPFQPTVAATFGQSRSLKRRIEMIANPNVKTSLSRSGLLLVVCGVVSLTLAPARAQQEAANTSDTATAGSERPGEPGEKEYWDFKTTINWRPGAKAKSFYASGDRPPGPGGKGSFDASVDWLSFLSAVNKTLPGAKTKSSPGNEVGPQSDAQRSIPTVLKELSVPVDGVLAEVLQVRLRPSLETDPGAVKFVLHMNVIRADGGAAPPDWESVHAFLKHWANTVTARGVKMMVEQLKMAPADQGNGVDLKVSLTLLPARAPDAKAASAPASPARVPGMGSAGKTKSPRGTKAGPESDAPARGTVPVLKELSADGGILAEVSQVRLRRENGSTAFVLHVNLIGADGSTAALDRESFHAFIKHWANTVNTRGVNMTQVSIRVDGVDLEIAGTLR
jgi:hypothetical protein